MKFYKNLVCLFFLIGGLLTSGCKSQKYGADSLPEVLIHFGEGGGFTGETVEYYLLENGQIFRKDEYEDIFTPVGKTRKKQAAICFEHSRKLQLGKKLFNKPGNKYFFIRYQDESGSHRITWGQSDQNIQAEIVKYYHSLKDLVKHNTKKRYQRKANDK